MAPLSNRQCEPEWFRKPFLNPSGQDERDIHDTLLACFKPNSMWTRLTSFKSGIRADAYQPNLAAIKFGLSQLLPKSLVPQAKPIAETAESPVNEAPPENQGQPTYEATLQADRVKTLMPYVFMETAEVQIRRHGLHSNDQRFIALFEIQRLKQEFVSRLERKAKVLHEHRSLVSESQHHVVELEKKAKAKNKLETLESDILSGTR
ncbi:hypothetical protein KIW84_073856 [Lathyrus oleraceus]|uniref:Uncharacterized protein n=1 Tax=Pisum sativum TaxID=3888 RepID=A0A9D4VSF1_PEA|nr:hypothetical protein KIW84_073856 [Pisum sativum]